MPPAIDPIMEQASRALVRMNYLACEQLCLQALTLARQAQDWPTYGRVLLPLQESRRHRRMIAAEGVIRLGTSQLWKSPTFQTQSSQSYGHPAASQGWPLQVSDAQLILRALPQPLPRMRLAACVVVTRPHPPETAAALIQVAREQHHFIEVLYADNESSSERWRLRSVAEPMVACAVGAPPAEWREHWLAAGTGASDPERIKAAQQPADWFIDATEALGDAALTSVTAPPGTVERVAALEACLTVVSDHELIHQRLGEAARDVRRKKSEP